jgi:hypothetical protein
MFQTNAMGIFGLVAVAICWAFAAVLYRVGSAGSVAHKLALLMVVEGVTLVTAGYIDLLLTPAATASSWYPTWYQATFIIHTIGDCAMLALYPPFLAVALQTKLTRPFSDKRVRIGLAGVAVVFFFAVNLSPLVVGAALLYLMLSLLFGFALVASIHAWAVAAPGIARSRARIFALAFGFRDICWGFIYAHGIILIAAGTYLNTPEPDFFYVVYASGTFFAVPLIAYGILQTQLFDIDLRIRWTIKQSTLAAIIVVIMFVLSEGAERLLSSELGNIGGLIVAALVVFLLTPLQRFAERVASVAMPNTQNTPEYIAGRKSQVYEAAISEAQEGGISQKERALLVRLRDSLGISASEADAIEDELHKRLSSFA